MQSFEILSTLMECSSGVVPKVETVCKFIGYISKMGYNRLYLGLADCYKVKEEPHFNYKRGGYTEDELKQIDQFGLEHGVEVVPQIQTLSHLHFLKKYPEYTELFDTDNVLMVGEERVYVLLEHMIQTIARCFTSKIIHIGFDEAFCIGTGEYKKKHGDKDKLELIMYHLNRVSQIVADCGKRCEMWDDMLSDSDDKETAYKKINEQMPDNVSVILWNYEVKETAEFCKMIDDRKRFTDELAFAGAAWKFLGFGPNNLYSLASIKAQIEACRQKEIRHYMLTMWADNANPTSFFVCLPVLFAAAEYASGKEAIDKAKFFDITGISYDDLYSLEYINYPKREPIVTKSSSSFWVFFNDILIGDFDLFLCDGIEKYYETLEADYAKLTGGNFGHIFEMSTKLMKVFKIKAPLTQKIRKAYGNKDKQQLAVCVEELKKLAAALEEFIEVFNRYFLTDFRTLGLEIQQIRYSAVLYRVKYAIQVIENHIETDEPIDELEEKIVPIEYYPVVTETNSCMVDSKMLISYSLA
ncbi:MAG: family 20 glycosylhydrolase [Clostridia bacterium]|nr:family 20 glycosylhydrolase [Clostridia bacterium]